MKIGKLKKIDIRELWNGEASDFTPWLAKDENIKQLGDVIQIELEVIDQEKKVDWAIFSDKYGVVFPHNKIEWYDKHRSKVKPDEFQDLVENFIKQLSKYDEIWFYHNTGRFHQLYRELVEEVRSKGINVRLFTHLFEIE